MCICYSVFSKSFGQGIPKITYNESDVLSRELSRIQAPDAYGHGRASMIDGYFFVPFFRDKKPGGGGFDIIDIADPENPVTLLRKYDSTTVLIREPHAYGMSFYDNRRILVMQAVNGIEIWDMTDVLNPFRIINFPLPDVNVGVDYGGIWWVSFQAPYAYVSGRSAGIYIVDLTKPEDPKLIKRIPISELGNYQIGANQVVGNYMIISSNEPSNIDASALGGNFTFMDISDPTNPQMLKTYGSDKTFPNGYAGLLNGEKLLMGGVGKHFHLLDVDDPLNVMVKEPLNLEAPGGYINYQDGIAYSGFHYKVALVDVTKENPVLLKAGSTDNDDKDDNFAIPLGNLVFASNDHVSYSSFMVAHAKPDYTPPEVNMVRPKDGAVNRALTSRIGLTFTDALKHRSISGASIIVRPAGGRPITGQYSYQVNIVNFWPDEPLLPNTTYEIVVKKEGVEDVSDNKIQKEFTSTFSTGAEISIPAKVTFSVPETAKRKTTVRFKVDSSSGNGTLKYSWNFGDDSPATEFSVSHEANHSFHKSGKYTVKVTVKDDKNQTAFSVKKIIIEK